MYSTAPFVQIGRSHGCRTSYIRTAGQEALYARFCILQLVGVDDTNDEDLGFWWGVGEWGA